MRTSLCLVVLLAAGPAWAGPKLSPLAEQKLDEGIVALYGLDYAKARTASRKLIEAEPDNPFGYLFEAGAIWWQASQEFGLFKDTPTLQGLFEQDIEAALRKADLYMDGKDKALKADGYFVSGMTHGTRGQWNLMKGKWFDAYRDGKKAVKHLKKCVSLDEGYEDAYLGLGVFDYQAAHLSGIAKLGALFGLRGDEKRGLERIQRAVDHATIARRQAAQFQLSIYLLDMKDDAKALAATERLRKDFPDSVYFVFLEAMLKAKLGDKDGSLAAAREVHKAVAADPKAFRRKWLTLVCGLSGEQCLSTADSERALEWLSWALEATAKEETPKKPDSFRTLLRLLRGQALDALGRRDEAAKDYQKVEFAPPIGESRDIARQCLASPCGREAILARLREFSRED